MGIFWEVYLIQVGLIVITAMIGSFYFDLTNSNVGFIFLGLTIGLILEAIAMLIATIGYLVDKK